MKSLTTKIEQQKNYEYRDSFRWVLTGLVAMLILCVLLTAAVVYKAIFPGTTKYYVSMTTGEVIRLPSLNEPVVTNAYIVQWSSIAARAALTLDFGNYSTQLKEASVYFSNKGWSAFSDALESSGLLETVKGKKLMMNAVVSKTPLIRFSGVVHGSFMWRISMPVLVNYGSASDQRQRILNVSMVVSRVSTLDVPQGIQIIDFEAK